MFDLRHHLMSLHGIKPTDTKTAVALDADHKPISTFTVTAEQAYDSLGGYWSLSLAAKVAPPCSWVKFAKEEHTSC